MLLKNTRCALGAMIFALLFPATALAFAPPKLGALSCAWGTKLWMDVSGDAGAPMDPTDKEAEEVAGAPAEAESSTELTQAAAVVSSADGSAETSKQRSRGRKRDVTIPLADVTAGVEYTGKVSSVLAYGAFVDIGTERDVLVHISEITNEYVDNTSEYVSNGDEVTLKIVEKQEDGKLQGTFILDDAVRADFRRSRGTGSKRGAAGKAERKVKDVSAFEDLDIREFFDGKVEKVVNAGAFVSVPSVAPGTWGWLHVSQLDTEESVEKAEDVLHVGKEVRVRVYKCEVEQGNLVFSTKPFRGRARGTPRRSVDGDGSDLSPLLREALSASVDDGPDPGPNPRASRGPRSPRRSQSDEGREVKDEEGADEWEKEYEAFKEQQSQGPDISFTVE